MGNNDMVIEGLRQIYDIYTLDEIGTGAFLICETNGCNGHHLLIGDIRPRNSWSHQQYEKISRRFNTCQLDDVDVKRSFVIKLKNHIMDIQEDDSVEHR